MYSHPEQNAFGLKKEKSLTDLKSSGDAQCIS